MTEHPIHDEIVALLKKHDYWFEEFFHEPVRTSEEAAALRDGYTLKEGAKAILIRAKIPHEGKKFVMLVLPGDKKFDARKARRALGSSDIRFATEEEVEEITKGVKPGGVPPFGNLFGLEVFCDPEAIDSERIIFNAGRTSSIAMKSADYKQIVQPVLAEIV
jgi:prolyl-tRNA editing enzyme YbaK/EbsC (Cys-tRNA(Pro) deacylase)